MTVREHFDDETWAKMSNCLWAGVEQDLRNKLRQHKKYQGIVSPQGPGGAVDHHDDPDIEERFEHAYDDA
jgi:hypothetical protein